MEKRDIYEKKVKMDWWLRRIKASDLAEATKKEILDFFDNCAATGLSMHRILFYADRLYPIAKMLGKPFREASRADIEAIVAQIERNDKLSPDTKGIYRVTLKKFYKWLEGNGTVCPDKVAWIKIRSSKNHILPEELLTKEDIDKLMDTAQNPRDKAIISLLYESGCRIGEMATLQLKNISFDEYGAILMVDGKTGRRRVRIIASVHYLTTWLEHHTDKKNPNAYLWTNLTWQHGKPMDYDTFRLQISKIAKKAGVQKRVNPHAFRHARATELAKMGLNEAQMSAYLGWVPDTDMAGTYIHLSGADLDNVLLGAYGIKKPDDQNTTPKCARCFKLNTVAARFCEGCGMPLSLRAAVEMEDKRVEFEKKIEPLMELLQSEEIRVYLADKLKVNER